MLRVSINLSIVAVSFCCTINKVLLMVQQKFTDSEDEGRVSCCYE